MLAAQYPKHQVPFCIQLTYNVGRERLGGIDKINTMLLTAPTFDPSMIEIFLALFSGGQVAIVSRGIVLSCSWPKFVQPMRTSVLQITPTHFMSLSVAQRVDLLLHCNLSHLIMGGEVFPRWLIAWLQSQSTTRPTPPLRLQIWNIYGTTECSVWASMCLMNDLENAVDLDGNVSLGVALRGAILESREGELWLGGEQRRCLVGDENAPER